MNDRELMAKLAFASFESRVSEYGIKPYMIKEAVSFGEVDGSTGFLKNLKDHLVRGTYSTKETTSPGFFASKDQLKNFGEKARAYNAKPPPDSYMNRLRKSFGKAPKKSIISTKPGIGRKLLNHAGRNLNRAFAGLTIADIGHTLTRKRKKGEGFFESVGRRAGRIGMTASAYGGPTAQTAGFASFVSEMAGGPGLTSIGAGAGKMLDKGVGKIKGIATGARKMFGGGKSFQQKKLMKMYKQKKIKLDEKNRFNLKAGYQK